MSEIHSHTTLINPPISGQKGDPHTGIPFMPFILAYLAAVLDRAGAQVKGAPASPELALRATR